MTSVTFFICPDQPERNRLSWLAYILNRSFPETPSFFVLVDSQETLHYYNEALWSPEHPFIPHCTAPYDGNMPQIVLGTNLQDALGTHCVVNATASPIDPTQLSEHALIIEWVTKECKDVLRKRYVAYKQQGLTLHNITLAES